MAGMMPVALEILGLDGKVVRRIAQPSGSMPISLAGLEAGVYFVHVRYPRGSRAWPLVLF
jgi:hypothetical protein